MKINKKMAKHTCDYVDLQDLTCINSILLSCLETCDLLFISMVYLSCFVRYSSDKASCSFFTHNLGGVYFTKNKMLLYHDSSCEKKNPTKPWYTCS